MKKLKSFNNNPHTRLYQVKYRPKSARGLFGASTWDHKKLSDLNKESSEKKMSPRSEKLSESTEFSPERSLRVKMGPRMSHSPGEPLLQYNSEGVGLGKLEPKSE